MEQKHITHSEDFSLDFGDADDDLSLSNLPILGHDLEDTTRRGSTTSDQDLFEFCGGSGSNLSRNNSVVVDGKIVGRIDGDGEVNEFRKRDYLSVKSASFHKALDYRMSGEDRSELRSVSRNRSSSEICVQRQCSPAVQKVNITAITSMSEKSRRRMFMFGPVKFKPEMDVIAIKKRQGRRPMQIPPMPEELEAVADGGRGGGRGKTGADGGMMKPLWYKSHLASALAKSFGCISASMV